MQGPGNFTTRRGSAREKLLGSKIVDSSRVFDFTFKVYLFCVELQSQLPHKISQPFNYPQIGLLEGSGVPKPHNEAANMAEDKLKGMDHSEVHYFNRYANFHGKIIM